MTVYYPGGGFTSFSTINGFIQAVIWFILMLFHAVPPILANYYIVSMPAFAASVLAYFAIVLLLLMCMCLCRDLLDFSHIASRGWNFAMDHSSLTNSVLCCCLHLPPALYLYPALHIFFRSLFQTVFYYWCLLSSMVMLIGHSGPVVAQIAQQTKIFLCFLQSSLRYAALGTGCILTVVPTSTQLSTLRGTLNEYQPYGWVLIQMAMGECSVYSSLQADSKIKFAAWPTSWRPPGTDRLSSRWSKVNSCIWLAPYR